MTAPVFKIAPTTQSYDWGKTGKASKVAQFAASSKLPGFSVHEGKPYAELWMGTHPTSPSTLLSPLSGRLSEHLKANPSQISESIIEKFPDAKEGNLPFLFKVLSIEKALSIQSHPDKKTAEELHRTRPDVYKDPNHKPEMALALTPFQALCGFRPLPQIQSFLSLVPELSSLIPPTITSTFLSLSPNSPEPEEKAALKNVFASLMTADPALIKEQLVSLVARYEKGDVKSGEESVADLVKRLNEQFPGDVGVFCAFVLNYVHLQPGEAIFLGAGEPHAYIYGECIECMANSDNVIRAGLTPKLRDIPNLVSGLTYVPAPPSRHLVYPEPFASSSYSTLYDPPISEFSVIQIKVPQGEREEHVALGGPSLVIFTQGRGVVTYEGGEVEVIEGEVVFVAAGTKVVFDNKGEEEWVAYRAFVEA